MTCSEEALEALSRGELSGASLRATRIHLAGCGECTRELGWLVREQAAVALVVATSGPLPAVESVLARVVPPPREPRWAWVTGVLALGLAPAAALLTILTLGSPLPVTAIANGELAAVEPAPACFLGGDGAEGDVARLEAMFAACLVASPGPARRGDRTVTEALFSPHGREACE